MANPSAFATVNHIPLALGIPYVSLVQGDLVLGYLSTQASRQQADTDLAMQIASENLAFCSNWGIPAGSAEHASCVLDLTGIRARAEQRVRDEVASQF